MSTPFALIIFGGTGDLAIHKLFPALFALFRNNFLPMEFYIIGFSRRDLTNEQYRELIAQELKDQGTDIHTEFLNHIYYQQGMFAENEGYLNLIPRLNAFDKKLNTCINRIFYLATPPNNYDSILENLKESKLSEGCGQGSGKWTKVAIEKPFGKDLETAKELDVRLSKIFNEEQIYRVDHYLGKDTLQSMIAFRFANSIFEPVWNNQYLDHVQISALETSDLSNRGRFFDGVGNLRDWGQNHIMQLAAAIVMEQPKSFSKEAIRDVRADALKNIRHIQPEEINEFVVRGQYEGYKQTKDVDPNSQTETFFALKMFFDSPRFRDIPFYIRAGKCMQDDYVAIHLVFKQTCSILFKEYGCPEIGNVLTIQLEPFEGIQLQVNAKMPGEKLKLSTVDMNFNYKHEFGREGSDAYVKLLWDILKGDQMLFNRSDELEYTWEYITKILLGWEKDSDNLFPYQAKSLGPKEAVDFIDRDNRKWIEYKKRDLSPSIPTSLR